MEIALVDPGAHDDFDYEFIGVLKLSRVVFNKTTCSSQWLMSIGELIPNGFSEIDVMGAIGDDKRIALLVTGDANGFNWLCAVNYACVSSFCEIAQYAAPPALYSLGRWD